VLGPSEGGLGGQDAPDGCPVSGRNAYPSGANAFFADVAQGFCLVEGLDFMDTFAPVASQLSVCVVLSIAAVKGFAVHQMDVVTAFLGCKLQ